MTGTDAGQALRAAAARLFARARERHGLDRRHPADGRPGAPDAELERGLAQLGAAAVLVPEERGGAGGALADLVELLEEAGAALLAPDLLTTTWAVSAVVAADGPADLLGPVLDGSRRWSALWSGVTAGTRDLVVGPSLDLRAAVDGTADVPLGAAVDDVVVVAPREDGGARVLLTSGAPAGSRRALDPTRPVAALAFGGPARVVGDLDAAAARRLRATWLVALAADSAGGIRSCLDAAVAHAGQRVAFGRPIGSFQAVQHRCADMFVAAETAHAAVSGAARAVDAGAESALDDALVALVHAARSYPAVAESSQLVFGGLGFTYACDAHFHVRRALVNAVLAGSAAALADELCVRVERA